MPARGGSWTGSKWIRPERRLAIYARDGHRCLWCGAAAPLSLDHLWGPWDHRSQSLVTSCSGCNSQRGGRRVSDWLRLLRLDGVELGPVVARLRAAVRAPVDIEAGRALLQDPLVRRSRREAGRAFRRNELPYLEVA